jgi:hypothetical protein
MKEDDKEKVNPDEVAISSPEGRALLKQPDGYESISFCSPGELTMRDRAVIDALPVANAKREVLTVGSGKCELDRHIAQEGYKVTSTDFKSSQEQIDIRNKHIDELDFHIADIFDISSFPIKGCETVICCEVLEHLEDWQTAVKNLLSLTHRRLIITVPWWRSYDVPGKPPAGHCNYWTDDGLDPERSLNTQDEVFRDINEFSTKMWPLHVNITKIATKGEDWVNSARCYVITIDKCQVADGVTQLSDLRKVPAIGIETATGNHLFEMVEIRLATPYSPPQRVGPYPQGYWPPSVMVVDYIKPDDDDLWMRGAGGSGPIDDEFELWYGAQSSEYVELFEDHGIRIVVWNTAKQTLEGDSLKQHLPFNLQRLGCQQIILRTTTGIDLEMLLNALPNAIASNVWFYLVPDEYQKVKNIIGDKDSKFNVINSEWVHFEKVATAIREKADLLQSNS